MAQHYQDNLGGWHELPDASFEHLLSRNHPGLTFTHKTQDEYDAAVNPPKTAAQIKQEANQVILAQIESLEGKTERGVREFILASLEREAVTLGAQQGLTQQEALTLAYSSNILYRKAKDVDTAIAALRAQLA